MSKSQPQPEPEYQLTAATSGEIESELERGLPLDPYELAQADLPSGLRLKLLRQSTFETVALAVIIALFCLGVVFVSLRYFAAPAGTTTPASPGEVERFNTPVIHTPPVTPGTPAVAPVPPLQEMLEWRYRFDANSFTPPVCAEDGTVLTTVDQDHLLALAPDGTVRYFFALQGAGMTSLSPPAATDLVGAIVGTSSGQVIKVNGWGASEWSMRVDGGVFTRPVLDRYSGVYSATSKGVVYCLTPTGTLGWKCQLQGRCTKSSPVLGPKGLVFQVNDDGALAAIVSGKLVWQSTLHLNPATQPVCDGRYLYTFHQEGQLVAITPQGQVTWRVNLGRHAMGSPALGQDAVYAGNSAGELYAVSPAGQIQWTAQLGGAPAGISVRPSDGRLYVWAQNGKYYAVDPDGTVLYSYDGELSANGVALGPTGTVYFANYGVITALHD